MSINRMSNSFSGRSAASSLLACVVAGAILLTAAMALAQERSSNQEGANKNAQASAEEPGFFGGIVNWFDRQASSIGSHLKGVGSQVENFGHEAGVAAKTTVDGAKGVGDAVVKIPGARLVRGHEKCQTAPNGAPDCLAAANAMCKSKGFESGKSADMTTAEVCPAQVYLSGRTTGEGCHAETFVSRAFCQ
jgi:hypothetical protein